MNIVKFKDIILTEESSGLPEFQCRLFNEKFKGKYVYCVNWLFCGALEDFTQEEYIQMSRSMNEHSLINDKLLPYDELVDYVDAQETERINSVLSYIAANKYAVDEDITIDELKIFRRWLALYLLMFDQEGGKQKEELFDSDTTHMLEYYAKDLYDDVVKYLSVFGRQDISLSTVVSSCGCNSLGTFGNTLTQVMSGAQGTKNVLGKSSCGCNTSLIAGSAALSSCDPLGIYRKNIYAKMVSVFREEAFWEQFSKSFLGDFKKYVDGIIEHNFPLTSTTYISAFVDCGCLSDFDAEQKRNVQILQNLSKSLTYIIEDDVNTHKNFIADALFQWSSLLYEHMYWN